MNRGISILAGLIMLASIPVGAQWTPTNYGVFGGQFLTVYTTGSTTFAGSATAGIFISTNNGTSWQASNNGLSNLSVNAIIVSGAKVYAGTAGGIFVSSDNGATWASTGITSYINSFCVSGANVFAATYGGPLASSDNGVTWVAKTTGLPVGDFKALTTTGTSIFAGNSNGQVFQSVDQGGHWTQTSLTAFYIYSLTANGNHVFATTNTGFFHSPDLGVSWTKLTNAPDPGLALLTLGGNIYMGGQSAVYKSIDNGGTWSAATIASNGSIMAIAGNGSNLFAVTYGSGAFLSTDSGVNWNTVNNGLISPGAVALIASGGKLFSGSNSGVGRSLDGGASWSFTNSGLTTPLITSLVAKNTFLFAGTDTGGVFISTDNGASWAPVNNGLTSLNIHDLAVSGNDVYAGTNIGLFVSSTNGASWTEVELGILHANVVKMTSHNTELFAITQGGLVNYTYDGLLWGSMGYYGNIQCLAYDGTTLVVGRDDGLHFSSDLGLSWHPVPGSLINSSVVALYTDGNNFFGSTQAGSVFLFSVSSITSLTGNLPFGQFIPAMTTLGSELMSSVVPIYNGSAGSIWHRNISGLPTIHSLSVYQGNVGTEVTIAGTNFSPATSGNLVQFNTLAAPVLSATPTELKVIVPSTSGDAAVKITIAGKSVVCLKSFSILPKITGFSPSKGIVGSSVILHGTGFDPATSFVNFGPWSSDASATNISITTTVPFSALTGPLSIISRGQTVQSPGTFEVLPYLSKFSPASGTLGTDVTLEGTSLGDPGDTVMVKFNGKPGLVLYHFSSNIGARVPDGALSGPISVTVHGRTTVSDSPFIVLPLPTYCFDPLPKPSVLIDYTPGGEPILSSSSRAGNQWYQDGHPIPGATSQDLIVTEVGSYTVQVYALGCISPLSEPTLIAIVTGIGGSPGESQRINIFPNPATETIVVDLTQLHNSVPVQLSLYNSVGEYMSNSEGRGGGKVVLRVADYPPGIYFVRLVQEGKTFVRKFAKL